MSSSDAFHEVLNTCKLGNSILALIFVVKEKKKNKKGNHDQLHHISYLKDQCSGLLVAPTRRPERSFSPGFSLGRDSTMQYTVSLQEVNT